MDDRQTFRDALKYCAFPVDEEAVTRCFRYADLIRDWNTRINLVSRCDAPRILSRHVFDSLCLVFAVRIEGGRRVLDLGSGAGFPGIPMALVREDLNLLLVESKRKKAFFLRKAVDELSLVNSAVCGERIETLAGSPPAVDLVVSRAVADLTTLIRWAQPLFQGRPGRLLAVKGPEAEEEIVRVRTSCPGVASHSVTPLYPRVYGEVRRDSRVIDIRFRSIDQND